MKENKNDSIILVGKKGKELWYPTFASHLDLDTGKSILDEIYKNPENRIYVNNNSKKYENRG